MKASDIARLEVPYHASASDDSSRSRAMPALGVDIPNYRKLESIILGDLTEQPPHGIGWWPIGLDARRRVLVSDQLYACTASVSDNMVEAGLHWLEFQDHAERESNRYADAVKLQNGQLVLEPPPLQSPLEEIGTPLVRMHALGIIRALSGALDCLAGTIIGVVALPKDILGADFNKVRDELKKQRQQSEGAKRQEEFGRALENAIGSVGPHGWLDWMLGFRNMLVHRGRRIEIGGYVQRTPVLLGPDEQVIPRANRVTHLPRYPGRSDIEVFLDSPQDLVLTEDWAQTLRGLLDSTRLLLEKTANDLIEVWNWRREYPQALLQPDAQWSSGSTKSRIAFSGYQPGTVPFTPSVSLMHPVIARRLRSAALDDESRAQPDGSD